jgi:hypothetical protein
VKPYRGSHPLLFSPTRPLIRFNSSLSSTIIKSAKEGNIVALEKGNLSHVEISSVQKEVRDRQNIIKLELVKSSFDQNINKSNQAHNFIAILGGGFGLGTGVGMLTNTISIQGLILTSLCMFITSVGIYGEYNRDREIEKNKNLQVEQEILDLQHKKLEELKTMKL